MKLHLKKNKNAPPRRRIISERQVPAAFSYRSQRAERPDAGNRLNPGQTSRPKRKLVDFWFKRTGFLIAMVVILICVVSTLSLSTSPRIIIVSSGSANYFLQQQSVYQQFAAHQLGSSLWNRNKITINTAALTAAMQQKFPELASASVTLPLLGHRPILYLQPNPPAFILNAVNGSFVLNSSGKALLTRAALPAKATASLPVVTDQTGLRVKLGQNALNSDDTTFIRTVLAELNAKQVSIGSLILPSGAAEELDVHLNGLPYYVKFNMHAQDARQQTGTFLATQANLKQQNITPSQYIDVRVDGRAYYQ